MRGAALDCLESSSDELLDDDAETSASGIQLDGNVVYFMYAALILISISNFSLYKDSIVTFLLGSDFTKDISLVINDNYLGRRAIMEKGYCLQRFISYN